MNFNMVDIGALPSSPECFYSLTEYFPGSRIHAFEIDPEVCSQLNREAPDGVEYRPKVFAHESMDTPLYRTKHPMFSSIFKPISKTIELFEGMEDFAFEGSDTIRVCTLDEVVKEEGLGLLDFIRVSASGAALLTLKGAKAQLDNSVLAVSVQTELMPLYEGGALYGQVVHFMNERGFRVAKTLGTTGRKLKDGLVEADLWADVLFMKDPIRFPLNPEAAQKMITLLEIHNVYGWTPYLNILAGAEKAA